MGMIRLLPSLFQERKNMPNNNQIKTKILLVDDDQILLNDIQKMVDWGSHGFEVAGKALNGKSAWNMIKNTNPQIVIADIRMPIMDGLELAKMIADANLPIRILLLTSYKDFDYARKALRYGVSSYFLKNDLTSELLLNEIKKLRIELCDADRILVEYKSGILRKYLIENKLQPEDKRKLQGLYLHLLVDMKPTLNNILKNTITFPYDRISLGSVFSNKFYVHGCYRISDFQVLIQVNQREPGNDVRFETLRYEARKMLQASGEENFHANILIDTSRRNPFDFLKEYRSLYIGGNSYYFHQEDLIILLDEVVENQIREVEELNFHKFFALFEERETRLFFEEMIKIKRIIFEDYNRNALIQFVLQSYQYLRNYYDEYPEAVLAIPADYYHAEDLFGWVYTSFQNVFDYQGKQCAKAYTKSVRDTIKYIEKNYMMKDLTIKKISQAVYMSEGRLSVLFRQDTNMTILGFITDLRMKKAQNLLRETNYKIYHIADMVGFSSSQYFSQVFFNYTGQKPIDYRNHKQNSEQVLFS
jgi:YesN/AraC family two-component response regulator